MQLRCILYPKPSPEWSSTWGHCEAFIKMLRCLCFPARSRNSSSQVFPDLDKHAFRISWFFLNRIRSHLTFEFAGRMRLNFTVCPAQLDQRAVSEIFWNLFKLSCRFKCYYLNAVVNHALRCSDDWFAFLRCQPVMLYRWQTPTDCNGILYFRDRKPLIKRCAKYAFLYL